MVHEKYLFRIIEVVMSAHLGREAAYGVNQCIQNFHKETSKRNTEILDIGHLPGYILDYSV